MGKRPNAELVNTMLDAAIDKIAVSGERPLVHSDRGGHYRWPGWLARIADAKLVRSMSRKGFSLDNAACEGFFGRLKTEMIFSRDCCPRPSKSLPRTWTSTLGGTTRFGARAHSRLAQHRASTAQAWESLFNLSKKSSAPPTGQYSIGANARILKRDAVALIIGTR
jgi:transposase InsO family protein